MNNNELLKYNIKTINENKDVKELLKDKDFTDTQKHILATRVKDPNKLNHYIEGALDITENLYDLKDVDKAGMVIAEAIKNKKHILIATDKDADGICSAALLHTALRDIFHLEYEKDFRTIVSKRKEGNGITQGFFNTIMKLHKEKPIDLIVGADHASGDEFFIKKIVDAGIEIVVTDHHEIPKDNYPISATVFVNNQRDDSTYSKKVSGCFIALLTMLSTYDKTYSNIDKQKFNTLLPYVALTTISDVMALDEPINRKMCKVGFQEMNRLTDPLWMALKQGFRITVNMDEMEVAFKLAPLINTGNRVDEEEIALKLLISNDYRLATHYIQQLTSLSKLRKIEQKKLYTEAEQQILDIEEKHSIVVVLESKLAINGIIASQIGEVYNKPTICFIDGGGEILSGSARGIVNGVNISEVFNKIKETDPTIMHKFGGHKMAGGCSVYREKLPKFRELADKFFAEQIPKDIGTHILIDKYIDAEEITPYLVKDIARLSPYGMKWNYPVYATKIKLTFIKFYGNMARIGFATKKSGMPINGMYFLNKNSTYTAQELLDKIVPGSEVILVFKPYMNNFNGSTNLQLNVVDIQLKDK